jgi:hypothetical protein
MHLPGYRHPYLGGVMGQAALLCTTLRCRMAGRLSRSPTRCCSSWRLAMAPCHLFARCARRPRALQPGGRLQLLPAHHFKLSCQRKDSLMRLQTFAADCCCQPVAESRCRLCLSDGSSVNVNQKRPRLLTLEIPHLQAALGLLRRMVHDGRESDGSPSRDRLKLIPRVVNVDDWARTAPLSGTVRTIHLWQSVLHDAEGPLQWAPLLQWPTVWRAYLGQLSGTTRITGVVAHLHGL